MQAEDGSLPGAATSITCSGGQSLLVETAALAVLAWLADPAYTTQTESAMRWLAEQCKAGAFGATQSTVLALKAIVEYDAARTRERADGRVSLVVDGRVLETIAFTKDASGALEFKDFAGALTSGAHAVALRLEGGAPMPYSLALEYHAHQPADASDSPLTVETRLEGAGVAGAVKEGDPVDLVARVRNTSEAGLPMTMVVVGLPGGLEPRHEQLKEGVKAGEFACYEIQGREIALYFRDWAPGLERSIRLSAIAAAPGLWTGPASRAYPYYTPESRRWSEGLSVAIEAKR